MNSRQYIYTIKAFAIFSVVCAHTAVEPANSTESLHFAVKVLSAIGTMGVPIFFIVSGYLFQNNQRNMKSFWIRKLKTIICPWLFCETLVWLYVVLRKGGVSVWSWTKFILGINHSTYYLTILIFFFIVFWYLKNNTVVIVLSMCFSCLSIIAYGWDLPLFSKFNDMFVTIYLNPFLWMMYFGLGLLLGKYQLLDRFAEFSWKIFPFALIGLLLSFGLHYIYNIPWLYYSKYALFNIALQILVVTGGGKKLSDKGYEIFIKVGYYSFTIYLLHELGTGGIIYLTGQAELSFLVYLRPIANIALVLFGIKIVHYFCEKWEWMKYIPEKLIGIRN